MGVGFTSPVGDMGSDCGAELISASAAASQVSSPSEVR